MFRETIVVVKFSDFVLLLNSVFAFHHTHTARPFFHRRNSEIRINRGNVIETSIIIILGQRTNAKSPPARGEQQLEGERGRKRATKSRGSRYFLA